jgi:hypothetical protein
MPTSQINSERQAELDTLIKQALSNPDIQQALRLYQLSEAAYAEAVAATQRTVIITSSSTSFVENANGNLGRSGTRNRKTRRTTDR